MFILNSLDRKIGKNKAKKEKNKFYKSLNLNDAIKTGLNDFRKLQQQHVDSQNQLRQSTTWLKYNTIAFPLFVYSLRKLI